MARIAEIKEEITIPDNVEITLENNNLTVKGENGSLSRVFSHTKINLKINGNIIEVKWLDIFSNPVLLTICSTGLYVLLS